MENIILLGYMGAGKTTVGKALAKRTGAQFYDLDWYIEARMRRTVPEIFRQEGEEGFRRIERAMLHEVAEFENVVLSLGGGTPCFFDNMEYVRQKGRTVYLEASAEVLAKHLRMGKVERPLIKGKAPEELLAFIKEQLQKRETFYKQAEIIFNVSLLDNYEKVSKSVSGILEALKL